MGPSGRGRLIVATVPLWMTALPWLAGRGRRPHSAALAGVALGLAGVATLVGGRRGRAGRPRRRDCSAADRPPGGQSLLGRRLALVPTAAAAEETAMATAMEMLAASPLMAFTALARGEWGWFHPAAVTPGPWLALAYLGVFGSLAGFGSYVFLLKHTTPARASTYAFVNPLVAVFLGTVLAGEAIGARTGVAALLIVAPWRRSSGAAGRAGPPPEGYVVGRGPRPPACG